MADEQGLGLFEGASSSHPACQQNQRSQLGSCLLWVRWPLKFIHLRFKSFVSSWSCLKWLNSVEVSAPYDRAAQLQQTRGLTLFSIWGDAEVCKEVDCRRREWTRQMTMGREKCNQIWRKFKALKHRTSFWNRRGKAEEKLCFSPFHFTGLSPVLFPFSRG